MLSVGIPKEIKPLEKRVGLIPSAVHELTSQGITVFVERGAGTESGFMDRDYQTAGAEIISDAASVYAKADLIQKVKEPLESEYRLIRKSQTLFCYLHLASPDNCALVETLVRSGATAIGFETVEIAGRFPLLAPMSEIAGALAAAYAGVLRQSGFLDMEHLDPCAGRVLFEAAAKEYPNFLNVPSPGKAVIFGGGVAGFKAMETVIALGGEAAVIEQNEERREFLARFSSAVFSPEDSLKRQLEAADVLIGCVHARGFRAAQVVDTKTLKAVSKKKRKIIIDVAIDQGGNFPESGPTTYQDPLYFDSHRNLRFAVANMPSFCGQGASRALSQAVLPYTEALAKSPQEAFTKFPELRSGINIQAGRIEIDAVRQAHRR